MTSGYGAPPIAARSRLSAVVAQPADPSTQLDVGELNDYAANVHHTLHLFGQDIQWFTEQLQNATFPFSLATALSFGLNDYQSGKHYTEVYNRAPFGPVMVSGSHVPAASRRGDVMTLFSSEVADRHQPVEAGFSSNETRRKTLLRNGEVVVDTTSNLFTLPPQTVAPEPATFQLNIEATRGHSPFNGELWFDLSTHVTASWTFRSGHTPDDRDAPLPLPTPRFLPELDDNNRAPGRVLVLPVEIQRPEHSPVRPITRITVDVSFDDGKSWHRVPGAGIGDRWFGVVLQPNQGEFASLRASVDDVDGRHTDVTILRAYRL